MIESVITVLCNDNRFYEFKNRSSLFIHRARFVAPPNACLSKFPCHPSIHFICFTVKIGFNVECVTLQPIECVCNENFHFRINTRAAFAGLNLVSVMLSIDEYVDVEYMCVCLLACGFLKHEKTTE